MLINGYQWPLSLRLVAVQAPVFEGILHATNNMGAVQAAICLELKRVMYLGTRMLSYDSHKRTRIFQEHQNLSFCSFERNLGRATPRWPHARTGPRRHQGKGGGEGLDLSCCGRVGSPKSNIHEASTLEALRIKAA